MNAPGVDFTGHVPRIGMVLVGSELEEGTRAFQAMLDGLAFRGYSPGSTVRLDVRRPGIDEAKRAVEDLLAASPELIIEFGSGHAARAAIAGTSDIPVILWSPQPIETGLVTDLDRPGGNVTGITFAPGRVESIFSLIRSVLPGMRRVAILVNLGYAIAPAYLKQAQAVAPAFDLQLETFEVTDVADLDRSFTALVSHGCELVYVQNHPMFNAPAGARRIAALGREHELPVISHYESIVRAGGLVGQPPDFVHWARRASEYAYRILAGAPAGSLPFEQSVPRRLIVNATTARALSVSIPQSILGDAEVIDR